jgi:pimeloyl-ACP methyl ester carboxylesterase
MSESRFVETNGIRLHYLDHGGDGPTLVLTHGLSANAHFFDGLAAAGLSPALRVLSFDLRGRGLSDKPEGDYSMATHAADLVGALDALGLDRILLGGHSFGGLLTYFVAAHHPERVERALVIDVPGSVDPAVMDQIRPSLARLEVTYPSREAYLGFLRTLPYFDSGGWDDSLEAFFDADLEELPDGTFRSRSRPEQIAAAAEGTLAVDWPPLISRVECPVLLVRTVEPYGPPGSPPIMDEAGAAAALALLRDGRLLEIEGNHITFAFAGRALAVARRLVAFATGDRVAA